MRRKIQTSNTNPAFLGIGTGKKAKAEADAAVKKIQAETAAALQLEQAKRDTLTLQLAQAKVGYDPIKSAAETTQKIEETKANASNTIYYVIAAIVLIVIIGLYFITKKR